MAAAATGPRERAEKCAYCPAHRVHIPTEHGWRVHLGLCREKFGREQERMSGGEKDDVEDFPFDIVSLPPSADEVIRTAVDSDDLEEAHEMDVARAGAVGDVEGSFVFSPFRSEADFRLAQLFTSRNDLGKGMLDAFLRVSRNGPFLAKSADDLLRTMDSLPGLIFRPYHIPLPGVDKAKQAVTHRYRFFSRSLLDCVTFLLDRHGEKLQLPYLLEGRPMWLEEVWEGERYQAVFRSFRQEAAPRDLLLPLILFSDETCLTIFNTMSDQSTTYPMFLTLGTLPKDVRRSQSGLVNVAVLPKYLKRQHRGGAPVHAGNKRTLTWEALTIILGDLLPTNNDDDEEDPGKPLQTFMYVVIE